MLPKSSFTLPGKWPARRTSLHDFRRVLYLEADLRRAYVGHALQVLNLQQPQLVDARMGRAAAARFARDPVGRTPTRVRARRLARWLPHAG